MPRFLFWNYRYAGPDKETLIARLVHAEAIDVVILAESSLDGAELIRHLGSQGRPYAAMPVPHYRVEIFAGYSSGCFLDWERDEGRLCLRKINLDQVLIGYDLLDDFPEDRFRILTSIPGPDGERPLIRETPQHWKIEVSDHLPILFDLDLPLEGNHG